MIILFLLTILSYTPLKAELVSIAGNATLTNNAVIMFNNIFGIIWIMFAVFWLGMAIFYAVD